MMNGSVKWRRCIWHTRKNTEGPGIKNWETYSDVGLRWNVSLLKTRPGNIYGKTRSRGKRGKEGAKKRGQHRLDKLSRYQARSWYVWKGRQRNNRVKKVWRSVLHRTRLRERIWGRKSWEDDSIFTLSQLKSFLIVNWTWLIINQSSITLRVYFLPFKVTDVVVDK